MNTGVHMETGNMVISKSRSNQRGVTLLGLMFWAVVVGMGAVIVMSVLPTVNEYATIQKAVNKLAKEGGTTVQEIRNNFEKIKQIEYSISSIDSKDLIITKQNEKIVIRFAYDKQIPLVEPVYLLIKYEGEARSN